MSDTKDHLTLICNL